MRVYGCASVYVSLVLRVQHCVCVSLAFGLRVYPPPHVTCILLLTTLCVCQSGVRFACVSYACVCVCVLCYLSLSLSLSHSRSRSLARSLSRARTRARSLSLSLSLTHSLPLSLPPSLPPTHKKKPLIHSRSLSLTPGAVCSAYAA